MRRKLIRALGTGLLFSCTYFAIELIGTVAVLQWSGTRDILVEVLAELCWLFLQYCAFGAGLGLLLAFPVAGLEAVLPRRLTGARLNFVLLALSFAGLSLFWNAESIVLRGIYALMAVGALLLILLFWLARQLLRYLLPSPYLRTASRLAWAVCALVGVAAAGRSWLAPQKRAVDRPTLESTSPNVVLIVIDTLRRDHLSAYGYERMTSPNVDRLAAEGALFERAYTTAPWTLPSHASIFTGLYPTSHEAYYGQIRLGSDKPTMAEILRRHGYWTAGFSGNPWVSSLTGLDRGFDRFDYRGAQFVTETFFLNLLKGGQHADQGAVDIASRLIAWIQQMHRAEKPFFAFANFMEVHEPYGAVPEPYFSRFLDAPLPKTVGREWIRDTPFFFCETCDPSAAVRGGVGSVNRGLECTDGRWTATDDRLRHGRALYDAGILYVDQQIGRIYGALEQAGVLDRTLFIVTSDHGEFLGEHGRLGHGVFLYDPVLSVPLILRYPPQIRAGQRMPAVVSLIQILPTVAELAGLSLKGLASSLLSSGAPLPAILAEDFPFDAGTVETLGKGLRCDYHRVGYSRAALLRDKLKYIWASGEGPELYDLDADPGEAHNLVQQRPETAREMARELQELRLALAPAQPSGQDVEIDPFRKKALESLGYVQ